MVVSVRPKFTKRRRRVGGRRICPTCKHSHRETEKIRGKTVRPHECLKCGTKLPEKVSYARKPQYRWYVHIREPDGKERTVACRSSEHADETIRQLERTYTPDEIQRQLTDHVLALIQQISADDIDAAIGKLVERLGGDATGMSLKPVSWDEAREIIVAEMREKGLSEVYVEDVTRVTHYVSVITGLTEWRDVDLDAITAYRSARLAGGWTLDGRVMRRVSGRAVNRDLRTLAGFLSRAVRKGWIAKNPLEKQPGELVKVLGVRVEHMPDDDLAALIEAADSVWLLAFVIVAYYTGARRGDLLRLEWDTDVDLDGSKASAEGRTGPHIYVRGAKADTPHFGCLYTRLRLRLCVSFGVSR